MCVSTGGSGLAALYLGDKASKLAILLERVSSKLDTSDFWIGGAYFGPSGFYKVQTPSNWIWFPTWNTSFTNLGAFEGEKEMTSNPWLWKKPFPSMDGEYFTQAAVSDRPNSCTIVRYNASESNIWWEQRACGGSNVSSFVRTHTLPPFPLPFNTFLPYRMVLFPSVLQFYNYVYSL